MSSPADKCSPNVRNVTKITHEATSKCEAQLELRIAHSPPVEKRRTELVNQEPCPSPISRLGFDILSLVFELCSEDDWTAPLRIGVINRQWREVILATPRAWTFIRLDNKYGAKLTSFYFERSGRYLHHVRLNDQSDFDLFLTMSHRIQCLAISSIYFGGILDLNLPNLTRITLDNRNVYLSQVAASKFPALQHLSVALVISDSFPVKVVFPPLQSLRLFADSDPAWIELAQGCRNSLISVSLGITNWVTSGIYTDLCLPKLRTLRLTSLFDSPWSVDIKTPELATYVQDHAMRMPSRHLLHKDLSGVTSLYLHYVPSLSMFPKLRSFHLTLGSSNAHLETLAQLNTGGSACPLLRLLVLNMPVMSLVARQEAQKAMDEWSMRHRPELVTRVTGQGQKSDFPEDIRPLCGQSMPCNTVGL